MFSLQLTDYAPVMVSLQYQEQLQSLKKINFVHSAKSILDFPRDARKILSS